MLGPAPGPVPSRFPCLEFPEKAWGTVEASLSHEYRCMVNYEESVGLRGCGGRDEGILSSPGSGKNDFFPATAGLETS